MKKNPTKLAVLVAVVVVIASPGSATGADTRSALGDCVPGAGWGTLQPGLASNLLTLINEHRASVGRPALKISPTLTASANWKSMHMAYYLYFGSADPAPPVDRSVSDRLAACGYPSNAYADESIASGPYPYLSAAGVLNVWLSSAGQRAKNLFVGIQTRLQPASARRSRTISLSSPAFPMQ